MSDECHHKQDLVVVHRMLHVFEAAYKTQAINNGMTSEIEEIDKLNEKILEALRPVLMDQPKYRGGLCIWAVLLAACHVAGPGTSGPGAPN